MGWQKADFQARSAACRAAEGKDPRARALLEHAVSQREYGTSIPLGLGSRLKGLTSLPNGFYAEYLALCFLKPPDKR